MCEIITLNVKRKIKVILDLDILHPTIESGSDPSENPNSDPDPQHCFTLVHQLPSPTQTELQTKPDLLAVFMNE